MVDLPIGTVTFLFTDIEGSTRLLQDLGAERYRAALEDHRRLLRSAFALHGGHEIDTQGDAFFVVFQQAPDAVLAAADAQRALAMRPWPEGHPVRVRMGMHTGEAIVDGGSYVGLSVHRGARIAHAAHGGQVLLSEPTLGEVRGSLPVHVRVRELGEHWLKDLDRPEQLSQLLIDGLVADFPALRTASRRPINLPAEVTSFIGREAQEQLIEQALHQSRLVSLVGPGGTGKTRLALRVAAHLAGQYPGGVTFVALEGLRDAELVPGALADALGLRQDPAVLVANSVSDYLRDRRALIVLDNLEQVVTAAPFVARLLKESEQLRVLATSRVSLHVAGERTVSVPPLQLPDPAKLPPLEELRRSESVALFVARAQDADPSFELTDGNAAPVAAVCARLDGLPLAIELAAARIRILTPEAMLERLARPLALLGSPTGSTPERQRTLRGAITWSHDLLSNDERAIFRRLSVFAGGWTLPAAEAVAGNEAEVFDGVASLVDKSLVRRHDRAGEPHFEMLATIREFAAEQLAAAPVEEAETRRRHAAHWLAFAQRLAPSLEQGSDATLRLIDEQENLRAALRFTLGAEPAATPEAPDIGLPLAIALGRFWTLNAAREGSTWLERAIAVASGADLMTQGEVRFWSGVLLDEQARGAEAERSLTESLQRFRDLGDKPWQARVLNSLGVVARSQGDLARARDLLTQSLAIRREVGPEDRLAAVLSNLGVVAADEGRLDEARGYLEASLEIDRSSENLDGIATGVGNLGGVALRSGNLEEGERLTAESLQLFARVGDVLGMADDLEHAAEAAAMRGDHARAARLLGAVETIRLREGLRMPEVDLTRYRAIADEIRGALGPDAYAAAYNGGCTLTREAAVEEAVAGLTAV